MMDELYPECAHGPLDEDDREWIQRCKIHLNTIYNEDTLLLVVGDGKSCFTLIHFSASKVCEKLNHLLLNKSLLKDIKMISPHYQTSSLEALYSLDIIFAFLAMYTR